MAAMRLPEKCFEWKAKGWTLGITLCPGIWCFRVWWDGDPYSLVVTLPFMHLWCEHDAGSYRRWDWTILRIVIGKREIRTDLALNYWGVGFVMHETDYWSVHFGPIDIECEFDKFYDDDDDEWIGPANLRLFSKVRVRCECERQYGPHS
jgi:hypothetical protein